MNIYEINGIDYHWLYHILINGGVSTTMAEWINLLMLVVVLAILLYILYKLCNKLLRVSLGKVAKRTEGLFDDYLIQYKTYKYLAQVLPLIIATRLLPWILADFKEYIALANIAVDIYMILLVIWIIKAFLFAGRDYLKTKDTFKDKPLESFVQVVMIAIYIAAALLIFSRITGKSVIAFLTAMGAASAVLLLIFKDSLLGFVASIQVSANDMVRIGDWITLDKYGADGTVVEINLTTVKVQNFDNTVTTIPTYYLISDSFKNWREMQKVGGRRIKRAINIKLSSIHHLTDGDIEKAKEITLIKSYITKAEKEIEAFNIQSKADKSVLINGRNLTNIGIFRKYIELYLERHPKIHKDFTMMARQLAPTEKGMPIEIYAFTNDTAWLHYENIMADIFDHLIASVKYFDLEIFEFPTSDNFVKYNTASFA